MPVPAQPLSLPYLACVLAALLPAPSAGQAAAAGLVHREFREVDTLFANPGQGWMSWQTNARFPIAVVYSRYSWADLEPQEGRPNWQPLDDALASARARGATLGFRIMTCNAHSRGYHTSPKWLFDAGCRGFEFLVGGDDPTSGGQRIPRFEPDYADPLYLAKHGAFLKALGTRYDGHADLEFVDIGSYGIWGEWHTKHSAPVAVRKQIVDLYRAAFRHTPLIFMSDDAEVLHYALPHGVGMRRDGVGSPWHEQNWIGSKKYAGVTGMVDAWQRAPIVFEWFGNYEYLHSRNWSFDAAVNFMLSNHVTLINDNIGRVPPEALPQLQKLARLAGARFVLRELMHPEVAPRGAPLELTTRWANVGAGKLHHRYTLRWSLLAATGEPAFATDSQADPRAWLPGEYPLTDKFTVPSTLSPGEYRLAVSLVDATARRRPFRLAFDAPEQAGRYEVSRVHVR
jgi:hypothetical protein